MLGKVKAKAIKSMVEKLEATVGDDLTEKLDTFKSLKPADVQDDAK